MGVTSAIVLYVVIWAATFLTILPIGIKTQGDVGEIVHGTQAGAPHEHGLKKKAWITTAIAAVIWLLVFLTITRGWITLEDIDFYNRLDR